MLKIVADYIDCRIVMNRFIFLAYAIIAPLIASADLTWQSDNLLGNIPDISAASDGWLVQLYVAEDQNTLLNNLNFQANGMPLASSTADDVRMTNFTSTLTYTVVFSEVVDFNEIFTSFNEIKGKAVYTVILDAPSWEEAIPGVSRTFVLDATPALLTSSSIQTYSVPHTNPGGHAWQIVQGGAAQGTESFETGTAGWQFGVDPDSVWSWATGAVHLAFDAIGSPTTRSSSLTGGSVASSAQFVGDYSAAGVQLIGFEFYPEDALPDGLTITLSADGAGVVSDVTGRATTVGSWNQIAVPVTATATSFWQSVNGGQLTDILSNVQEFRIDVGVETESAQGYRIRNIFLDLLPVAADIQIPLASGPEIAWDHLRTNWNYRVDASTNLIDQVWASAGQFTATNRVTGFVAGTNEHFQIYRLVIE